MQLVCAKEGVSRQESLRRAAGLSLTLTFVRASKIGSFRTILSGCIDEAINRKFTGVERVLLDVQWKKCKI